MRAVRLHPQLTGHRLIRVGIEGNTIYIQPIRSDSVQVWSLHTLFPNSWQLIFNVEVDKLYYSLPSCSSHHLIIFVLIVAVFKGEELPRVSLFEINRVNEESKEYRLDESSGIVFENVSLENAILGCGRGTLHIYDRSIVMGAIPYWEITLLTNTFVLERNDIKDDSEIRCSRFPIAIDSGNRIFARLKDDHSFFVYEPIIEKWKPYNMSAGSDLILDSLNVRGLHETYGRSGHRMGAIESPLTIYTDNDICIAKIIKNHKHYFYKVILGELIHQHSEPLTDGSNSKYIQVNPCPLFSNAEGIYLLSNLDHERSEFRCEQCSCTQFTGGIDRMFYTLVGDRTLVIIGIQAIAITQLQPSTLVESALWALQLYCSRSDSNNARSGGISYDKLKSILGYTGCKSIAK